MAKPDWSALKDPVEVISKIVVTMAVAVGGLWAWYTFSGELKRENARAQLEKLGHELEASKRFAIEVDIKAKPLPSTGQELHVEVEVLVINKGSRDADIPILAKSLRITPITTPDLPAQPSLEPRSSVFPVPLLTDSEGQRVDIKSIKLPGGTENRLLYLAQVDSAGRYLVEFSTPSSGFDKDAAKDTELSASHVVDVPSATPHNKGAKPPASRDRRKVGD